MRRILIQIQVQVVLGSLVVDGDLDRGADASFLEQLARLPAGVVRLLVHQRSVEEILGLRGRQGPFVEVERGRLVLVLVLAVVQAADLVLRLLLDHLGARAGLGSLGAQNWPGSLQRNNLNNKKLF